LGNKIDPEIKFNTYNQIEFVDITHKIKTKVKETEIKEGTCFITIPHVSAGLMIGSSEEDFLSNVEVLLGNLVPSAPGYYRHNDVDTNAEAQLKAVLLGSSKMIPVTDGKLALGYMQKIFFVEFDGARERFAYVTVIGNDAFTLRCSET
jgi:secondary thiamine-phosphate synthase enzyme